MRDEFFSDNRRVKQGRNYADFMAIAILQYQGDEYPCDYEVHISRYVVSGRMDYYSFREMNDGSTVYRSELCDGISEAVPMMQKDFDRPQIVEMVLRMSRKRNFKTLIRFIGQLAPKSKTYRAGKSLIRKIEKQNEQSKKTQAA